MIDKNLDWEKCFVCPSLLVETIDERLKRKQAESVRQASRQLERESEGTWQANTIRQMYKRQTGMGTNVPKIPKSSYETCTIDDLHKLIDANKTFSTIYADPPWAYDNQGTRAATSRHYLSLSPDKIARVSHEFLLLGIKGSLTFQDKKQKSWLELRRGKHSQKPEEIADIIEKVSPGPYLELFGRRERKNWTVWGNQIPKQAFLKM